MYAYAYDYACPVSMTVMIRDGNSSTSPALPYLAFHHLALLCLALPCLAMSCLAIPCHVSPCHAMPCLALPVTSSIDTRSVQLPLPTLIPSHHFCHPAYT